MKFTSNGKLLLAGEYLVLKGAKAFAVPVNFGQSMLVTEENGDEIFWESYSNDDLWFSARIKPGTLQIIETTDIQIAKRLIKILDAAGNLSNGFFKKQNGIKVVNRADFDINWGLGSSSTLIANIAGWTGIDPFDLHFAVSGGSGYDIACALSEGPVFYYLDNKNPKTEKVDFNPEYAGNIYFVWLGNKKNSADEVSSFRMIKKRLHYEIGEISQLSDNIAYAPSLEDFEYYLREHELIISSILKRKTVKEELFYDYFGEMKSLGAWGGDFIMVTSDRPFSNIKNYFGNKGLNTVIPFKDMVKVW
jgi:mevalonate kinase